VLDLAALKAPLRQDDEDATKGSTKTFLAISSEVRPYWRSVVLIQLSALGVIGTTSCSLWLLRKLTQALETGDTAPLLWAPPVALGTVCAMVVIEAMRRSLSQSVAIDVGNNLQSLLYRRLLDQDMTRDIRMNLGEKLTRLQVDVAWYTQGLAVFLGSTLYLPLMLLVYGGMLFWHAPILALCALVGLPLQLVFGRWIAKRMRRNAQGGQILAERISAQLVDTLSNPMMMRMHRGALGEPGRFGDMLGDSRKNAVESLWLGVRLDACNRILGALLLCLLAAVLSRTDLISAIAVALLFIPETNKLGNAYSQFQRAVVAATRISQLLGRTGSRSAGTFEKSDFSGELRMRDIKFGYDPATPVISGADFRLAKGETVVVAGASGEGKTTLVRLMVGLLLPQQGGVSIDGIDIDALDDLSRRRLFAYVPQEAPLLQRSIAENVAYGRPEATQADIDAALRAACADSFVASLPEGNATQLMSSGANLSSGQRQRLTIARAICARPPIIILDEAFSHIDLPTEARIIGNIRSIGGVSLVVISHRHYHMYQAERIYILQSGTLRSAQEHDREMVRLYVQGS